MSIANDDVQADPSWSSLLNDVCRHFAATAQDQCLLWVDPSRADPFEDDEFVAQRRVRVPILHPHFDPIHAPYLVPLDLSRSADTDVLCSSVELAWLSWSREYLDAMRGQPICGWVRTAASPKAVAGHWGRHCHLHLVKGQSKLLRFQDAGVREWLWPTLDTTQRRTLLGPVAEVLALGRSRQLIQHAAGGAGWTDGTLDASRMLQLDQAQWAQLDDYAVLHAAWRTWRNAMADDAKPTQAAGWEAQILRALVHANELGVHDDGDRELFALHALQLGPDFHLHPQLATVWARTRAGDYYGTAVEEVTGYPADQLGASMGALHS